MNINQFKKIDRNNETPVYLAIREQIKTFIDSNPDNSTFPPERKLTEQLGVNRRTLRKAIEPFTNVLLRGPMGTVLRKQPLPDADISIDEVHPQLFQNHSFFPQSCRTLKLGIYENLPSQQKFWTKITKEFNKTNNSCKIELEFISAKIENFNEYISDALSGKTGFDLIQLPTFANSLYDEESLLRKSSQSFIDYISSDAFSIKKIFKYVPDYMEKILPVYHVPHVQIVNPQFAPSSFAEEFCRLMNESPVQAWEEGFKQIPEDVYLTSHTGDLFLHAGLSWPENEQVSREIINERYDTIVPAREREKSFAMPICSNYFIAENIKNLSRGKVFSAYIPTLFVPLTATSNKDQIVILTERTAPGRVYLSSEVALGICANCDEPGLLEEFGRFLLSDAVQSRVVRELHSLPFSYQAANCLDETFTICGKLEKAHSKYSIFSREMCQFFFSKNTQPIWHESIFNNLSKEDVVKMILNTYFGGE
jgi:hypothetical protein